MPILSRVFHQINSFSGEIFNNTKNKFCVVILLRVSSVHPQQRWNEKIKKATFLIFSKAKTLISAAQFLGRFFTSLDWNYYSNVIGALIPKIFAQSTAIVATSISFEIPSTEAQQSKCNFNYKRQTKFWQTYIDGEFIPVSVKHRSPEFPVTVTPIPWNSLSGMKFGTSCSTFITCAVRFPSYYIFKKKKRPLCTLRLAHTYSYTIYR